MKFAPQIIFVVLIVGSGLFAWSWMVSDISGEYASSDRKQGHVSMSIIRKATTIKANLALGHGAMLEATVPSATSGQQLNWDFSVPQKWIDKGQVQRTINFKGKVENGMVTGVLSSGKRSLPIKLSRNGIASMNRMFQSHLPWVN